MKLFNAIATAAVIGSSIIFPNIAEARAYSARCNFNNQVNMACIVSSRTGYLGITWEDRIRDEYKVGSNNWLNAYESLPSKLSNN